MSIADTGQIVAVIPKNAKEETRVELTEFKGHDLVSVRIYADSDNSPDRVPSRKGISLQVKHLRPLISALVKTEDLAVRNGLLPALQEAAQ